MKKLCDSNRVCLGWRTNISDDDHDDNDYDHNDYDAVDQRWSDNNRPNGNTVNYHNCTTK